MDQEARDVEARIGTFTIYLSFVEHLYKMVEGFEVLADGMDEENERERDYKMGIKSVTSGIRVLLREHHIRKPKQLRPLVNPTQPPEVGQ